MQLVFLVSVLSALCWSAWSNPVFAASSASPLAAASPPSADLLASTISLGAFVQTWYSFQDNTPVNSALSGSGRELVPYISIAVPFRLLKKFNATAPLDYGDAVWSSFMAGHIMPNGVVHNGWLRVDDFCGDNSDDSYCFQEYNGSLYPNTDIYVGDFVTSGMDWNSCEGPAGTGQDLTNIYAFANTSSVTSSRLTLTLALTLTARGGDSLFGSYGSQRLGNGTCGDAVVAKEQQVNCWDYTPPTNSSSMCQYCSPRDCAVKFID